MLERNLIKIYEQSFRDNREMSAITDYFKGETFSYYEVAKEVAKLHLMFKEAGIEKGEKIALIGRNNTRWCISYIATITYGVGSYSLVITTGMISRATRFQTLMRYSLLLIFMLYMSVRVIRLPTT